MSNFVKFWINFGSILGPFWVHFGVQDGLQDEIQHKSLFCHDFGPFLVHLGGQVGAKLSPFGHLELLKVTFLHVELQPKNVLKLNGLLDPSWRRFWTDFGSQNGSKIGTKRDLVKYVKTLKNRWFFNDFGLWRGPR